MDGVDVPITVEEINRARAINECKKWVSDQVKRITDQNAVIMVVAKAALNVSLSAEDKKIIDPEDETPGIGRSKSFEDSLDEFLTTGE